MQKKTCWLVVPVICACVLLPSLAGAQSLGSIAGVVRDASGGVLPGVSVEAASPALIEKVRSVITDASGNYKIVDLRPGTYTVTIALAGFTSYKREGIELSAGFTANVSADLKVGSLEETITVTGASPIVDVQNARTQNVMRSETLDQLPSGGKNLMAFAAMTLGATNSTAGRNDVGGDKGELSTGIVLHGGRGDDGRTNWDGMNTNVFFGGAGGQQRVYYFNTVAVQEVVIDTGGSSAETETGGANINMVPKEGSNSLKFFGLANYTDQNFSAAAVPDTIKARGLSDQSSLRKIYDYGVGVGGPLKQDKAWFYATHRSWGSQNFGAELYNDADTNPLTYTLGTVRSFTDNFAADSSFRATLQVTSKHKVNHEFHRQQSAIINFGIGGGGQTSPEASNDFGYGPQFLNQTTWSFTATNKLLIQAGATFLRQLVTFIPELDGVNRFTGAWNAAFPGPGVFAITDVAGIPGLYPAGFSYGTTGGGITSFGPDDNNNNFNQKLTVSYITGSHALKAGLQTLQGNYDFFGMQRGVEMVNYTLQAGRPVSLTMFAGPFQSYTRLRGEGLFVQDQWTVKRLTLNVGGRYDQFTGRTLAQDIPAGRFRPAYSVAERKNLPGFKDVSYRIGAAYDLFGSGKTAIKGGFGKYLMGQGGSLAQQGFAPSNAIATSTTRSWFGAAGVANPATGTVGNGDLVPNCVLENFAANGECGPITNPLFGQPFSAQTLADDVREGWGNREYSYQWNLQLQQELMPGVGLAVGYFHTQWQNMSVTRNTRVLPSDYTSYCATAPSDPRIGATAGQPICGYYELTAAGQAKGAAFEITQARNFGEQTDNFDGIDIGLNARFGKGSLVSGGVSVGREVFDFCYVNDRPDLTPQAFAVTAFSTARHPRNSDFCKVTPPWWSGIGSQAKLQFVYPLPYDIVVSGAYKHLPGSSVSGNNVLTAAQVGAILGRPSTAAGVVAHAVIPIQGGGAAGASTAAATVFDERLNQTDLRLLKSIRMGRGKVQATFDVYNVFNARTPQGIINTIGVSYFRPTALLGGRLFKFGAQVDW
jgi:hypothetical protein